MIVYVESNFVLELARQQEEAVHADALLRLAEAGKIRLGFPVFAICEPFSTLTHYASERARFVMSMEKQLRELGRLEPHKGLASVLQPLGKILLSLEKSEIDSLELTVQRMLTIARPIAIDAKLFVNARKYELQYAMSAQDAIVFASVMADLARRPRREKKCFVSRNSKDFDNPGLLAELRPYDCRYIVRFADALGYAESELA